MAFPLINIKLYESQHLTDPPIVTLAAGTHIFRIQTNGNSLLSTVYVQTVSGSVAVNWFDYGPGGGDLGPGERVDLAQHLTISTNDTSDRISVPRLHNKAHCEVIVTGGPAQVGVYISVVASFTSDLDQNLFIDQTTANLTKDRGMIAMGYDTNTNKLGFLHLDGDALKVTGSFSVSLSEVTDFETLNETIALANTEQAYVFASNTRKFSFKARGLGLIKMATASGGDYITIYPGTVYTSETFAASAKTVYFQSPTAGLQIELERWF
jgi:hypothetical protein